MVRAKRNNAGPSKLHTRLTRMQYSPSNTTIYSSPSSHLLNTTDSSTTYNNINNKSKLCPCLLWNGMVDVNRYILIKLPHEFRSYVTDWIVKYVRSFCICVYMYIYMLPSLFYISHCGPTYSMFYAFLLYSTSIQWLYHKKSFKGYMRGLPPPNWMSTLFCDFVLSFLCVTFYIFISSSILILNLYWQLCIFGPNETFPKQTCFIKCT